MLKKNIIIIVVIVSLVVVAILIWGLKTNWQAKTSVNPQPETEKSVVHDKEEIKPEIDQEAMLKSQLILQSRAFIEKYGTYSLDSGYQNLKELLSLMSDKLAAETSMRIAQGPDRQQGFFSFVVKVGSIDISEFIPDTQAVFIAQIQEQEMRPGETNILQKTARLIMLKQGEGWKVDSIEIRD